jgi:hypothetical protein
MTETELSPEAGYLPVRVGYAAAIEFWNGIDDSKRRSLPEDAAACG